MVHGSVNGDTLNWWFKQSQEARDSVMSMPVPIKEALLEFGIYIRQWNPEFAWSHATFDHPILNNACKVLNYAPWMPFRKQLDLRSLEALAGDIIWDKREGTHHNAKDDAVFQAIHAAKMLNTFSVV